MQNQLIDKDKEKSKDIEQSNEKEEVKTYKKRNQFRALFLKQSSLQLKQKGTNICQILTPLICLTLVLILKEVGADNVPIGNNKASLPLIFNFRQYLTQLQNKGLIDLTTCLTWFKYSFTEDASKETIQYVGYNDGTRKEGILENINQKYCNYSVLNETNNRTSLMPYFKISNHTNQDMYDQLQYLNDLQFERFQDQEGIEVLPDGAVQFSSVNYNKLDYKVQINDLRIQEYHRTNGYTKIKYGGGGNNNQDKDKNKKQYAQLIVADGQLALADLINGAFIKSLNNTVQLLSGVIYMPLTDNNENFLMKVINMTGASLYPLALGLLLPVFMYSIVLEKEERILQMMKMNGLRLNIYWTVNFIFDFILYTITVLVFMFFGYFLLDLPFFQQTNIGIFIIIFTGWGISQISMAFLFSVFISKSRTANIIGYLVSIWLILTAVSLNIGIYPYPKPFPYGLRMIPTFCFCRIIYRLCIDCSNFQCWTSFSEIPSEINDCILWLYMMSIVLLFLSFYLYEVVPQEYGVNKHPLFIFQYLINLFRRNRRNRNRNRINNSDNSLTLRVSQYNGYDQYEDSDAHNERQKAYEYNTTLETELQRKMIDETPLIIQDLMKIYNKNKSNQKIAVKQLSLTVQKGEILGLLGPNGAGKTSLISMLTGLYSPNKGNAFINGYGIVDDLDNAQMHIGICPQFDLLWPQLTVEEHLLFYSRLKGIPSSKEKSNVQKAIKDVLLMNQKESQTCQLSGGMKRRLSVAISMVGDPVVIFLDEPTTGLDPENRRQLWDILSNQKKKYNRSMVLTTHSMEEADVLSNRIGIIKDGILRCIGPQQRLKTLYGGGYHLTVNIHKFNYVQNIESKEKEMDYEHYKGIQEEVVKFIKEINDKPILLSNFNGNMNFILQGNKISIAKIFEKMENNKERLFISDWAISQSNLEDVFVRIVDPVQNENQDDQIQEQK